MCHRPELRQDAPQHPNARRRSRTAAKGIPKGFLEQKLGVTHLGRTSFDILGGLVKVLGQATEHILQVGLPRYLGQSPGMVGFVAVMGCAVHKLINTPVH